MQAKPRVVHETYQVDGLFGVHDEVGPVLRSIGLDAQAFPSPCSGFASIPKESSDDTYGLLDREILSPARLRRAEDQDLDSEPLSKLQDAFQVSEHPDPPLVAVFEQPEIVLAEQKCLKRHDREPPPIP